MIRNIVLYNEAHIGDILFSQKTVKNIVESNPQYKFFYRIKYNFFLFQDIPNVETIGLERFPELDAMRKVPFCQLNDDTLMINTWIFALEPDYNKRNDIACHGLKLCKALSEKLKFINEMYKTDLKMQEYTIHEGLPTLPKTDIAKFVSWKTENKKPTLFFYNYLPMSGQVMPIANQDGLVIDLARRYSDHTIIVAKKTEKIAELMKTNSIANVFFSDTDFDCKETIDCKNLCQIAQIVGMCDVSIHLEIGGCFYYCNDDFVNTKNKIIQLCYDDHWYNQFKTNYEDAMFCERVHLLICKTNEDVERQLFPKLDGLIGNTVAPTNTLKPAKEGISYSIKDSKGIPIDLKLDVLFKKEGGFFVDVGAHDGLCQSNTAFLEKSRDWKGLCIEPSLSAYVSCVKNRPDSRVVNCACVSRDFGKPIVKGDFDGHLMASIGGARLKRSGEIATPARTLDRVLESKGVTHIDFLNIDVSGYEKEMLSGFSIQKYRPKYVLVEILRHNYDDVLKYFLDANYTLVANITNFGPPTWDGSHNDYLFMDNSA